MNCNLKKEISVAPMMDWTDRHCRYFHRRLTNYATLYTEMITADAILHGDRKRLLKFNSSEQPVILQIGGSDALKLSEAAKIGEDYGYKEINLNVGCPSPRVKKGRFGACLMKEPKLVHDCISTMRKAVNIPVTVKCRIGVDDMDDDEGLNNFITIVKNSGINTFIIHARKAWLQGLSPKQNREVPPLNYERVYRLKLDEPNLKIIINGGIETTKEVKTHLNFVDGVMIGRAAYHNPYFLSTIDQDFYGSANKVKSRIEVAQEMIPYIQDELNSGTKLHQITRHMLGLFHGQQGARYYRQILSQPGLDNFNQLDTYKKAISAVMTHETEIA